MDGKSARCCTSTRPLSPVPSAATAAFVLMAMDETPRLAAAHAICPCHQVEPVTLGHKQRGAGARYRRHPRQPQIVGVFASKNVPATANIRRMGRGVARAQCPCRNP